MRRALDRVEGACTSLQKALPRKGRRIRMNKRTEAIQALTPPVAVEGKFPSNI